MILFYGRKGMTDKKIIDDEITSEMFSREHNFEELTKFVRLCGARAKDINSVSSDDREQFATAFKATGYQYGEDALEQVYLGWHLRDAHAKAGLGDADSYEAYSNWYKSASDADMYQIWKLSHAHKEDAATAQRIRK